jgi:hypothetical protein
MKRILGGRRPSVAGVLAFAALFAALSVGAYAGSQLPRNSVGTKQLKAGAVTGPKIANGAVSDAKLAQGGAIAKAFGRVNYNANDVNPTPVLSNSRGIASVTEASDGVSSQNGVVCVDVTRPFSVVLATGIDAPGAASPAAFTSVSFGGGALSCPAGTDFRVSTYDKTNPGTVAASFSVVVF